jgi:hypothetical protein
MVIYKYIVTTGIFGGMAADRAIQRGILGKEESTSMIRWIRVSMAPPKYPEMEPIRIPSTKLIKVPAKGMVRDIWLPRIIREKRSRPMESEPKRKRCPPSSTPKKWISEGIRPQNLY